jgi:hypothetical protein
MLKRNGETPRHGSPRCLTMASTSGFKGVLEKCYALKHLKITKRYIAFTEGILNFAA